VVLVVYYPSSACRPWFEGIRSLDCQFAMARTDAAGSSRLVDDWWMGLDCQPWRWLGPCHGTVRSPPFQNCKSALPYHTRAHALPPPPVRRSFSSTSLI